MMESQYTNLSYDLKLFFIKQRKGEVGRRDTREGGRREEEMQGEGVGQ